MHDPIDQIPVIRRFTNDYFIVTLNPGCDNMVTGTIELKTDFSEIFDFTGMYNEDSDNAVLISGISEKVNWLGIHATSLLAFSGRLYGDHFEVSLFKQHLKFGYTALAKSLILYEEKVQFVREGVAGVYSISHLSN